MDYIKLARPKHYIKNLLIFLPLIFSGKLFELNLFFEVFITFLVFSLMASSIYIINDICDRDKDRLHERKRNRPIASGRVSVKNACIFLIVILITSMILMQTSAIEIIGVIIFVAVVAGFILNYKDKFAQVCISWVMFSALILLFIGWGAVENGMFLYSLYFFWAYLCLIYMGITKICKNVRHINISMTLLIIIMFSYNLPYFINFISFAVRHY